MHFKTPIGIIGFGVEGQSTCDWLIRRGMTDITVFDRKRPSQLPKGISYGGSGEDYLAGLTGMATAFRSAGVRPDAPEILAFSAAGGHLTSQVETAFDMVGRDRIVGVTGTVGKGTACSLLEAMLDRAGLPCVLAGNIGVPAIEAAESLPGALLVLELSSFQLSTLRQSPRRAAVLRTTVEHLDWHLNRREYWEHKANLVVHQIPGDFLAWCGDADGSRWISARSPARKRSFGVEGGILLNRESAEFVRENRRLTLAELKLTGAFNLENVAAAAALALDCGASFDAIAEAARNFVGLEHRLERVRTWQGLTYYNDSYATRPEATEGAIAALAPMPLGLILGGSDKLADFAHLARFITGKPHVLALALIGDTAESLHSHLQAAGFAGEMRRCQDLPDSLVFLQGRIPKGGAIALSPACASFGLFANYKERGKAFKSLVPGG